MKVGSRVKTIGGDTGLIGIVKRLKKNTKTDPGVIDITITNITDPKRWPKMKIGGWILYVYDGWQRNLKVL